MATVSGDPVGIAVAEPRVVEPALPFNALAGKRAVTEWLQLMISLFTKDISDRLADKVRSPDANCFGVLTIGIEVTAWS